LPQYSVPTIGQHAQKLRALLVEERNESFKRSAAVSSVLQFFERLAIPFACCIGMARPWFFGTAFVPWHLFPELIDDVTAPMPNEFSRFS